MSYCVKCGHELIEKENGIDGMVHFIVQTVMNLDFQCLIVQSVLWYLIPKR